MIALLLAKGAKPDVFTAAALGDTNRLARMLKDDPKQADARNGEGMTPLHFAALCKRLEAAKLLLDHKADANAKVDIDEYGATPLVCAIERDDTTMAELLLAHGADPLLKSEDGETLLHEAAYSPRLAMMELLLAHKLDVDAMDEHDLTALHRAASCGNLKVIELLLDRGADIDGKGKAHTPIFEAAEQGHLDAAELLRRRGAKLDFITAVRLGRVEDAAAFLKRDPKKVDWCDGAWPLEEAVATGNMAMARMLLDAGAKVNGAFADANGFGETPLHVAAAHGRKDAAELLLDRGAKIDLVDNRDTPLAVAAQNGHADLVRLLLKRGADLSDKGGSPLVDAAQRGHQEVVEVLLAELRAKGRPTPLEGALYYAALNSHRDIVEYLLAQGAGVGKKYPNGDTPLHLSALHADGATMALLLDKGAAVNAASKAGATPLHYVCLRAYGTTAEAVAAATELLKHGAAINVKDNDGDAPLHVAAKYADIDLVRLLLDHKADAKQANNAGKLPWELADAEGQDEIADLLRKAAEKQTGAKDIRDKRRPTSGGLAVGTIVHELAHQFSLDDGHYADSTGDGKPNQDDDFHTVQYGYDHPAPGYLWQDYWTGIRYGHGDAMHVLQPDGTFKDGTSFLLSLYLGDYSMLDDPK